MPLCLDILDVHLCAASMEVIQAKLDLLYEVYRRITYCDVEPDNAWC